MSKRTTVALLLVTLLAAASAAEPAPRHATAAETPCPSTRPSSTIRRKRRGSRTQLEKDFPAATRPEAVKMLVAILRGDVDDRRRRLVRPGRVAVRLEVARGANTRSIRRRARSRRSKFRGPAALFARLDRDGDGRIVAGDFDWSDKNPFVIQSGMVTRFFRRMNPRGDGKLTKEDMDAFFERAANGKDHVTPDDLRAALLASGPGGFLPGDAPTIEMLVRGLYSGELGSIHEGPKVGAAAPDFTLKTLDGKETVRLSKLIGPKPVVLVFGNFTCGPFRALTAGRGSDRPAPQGRGDVRDGLRPRGAPDRRLDDGVEHEGGRGGEAADDLRRAREGVRAVRAKLKPSFPVLVDEIDDRVGHAYSGMPARLYVIDAAGEGGVQERPRAVRLPRPARWSRRW